MIKNTIKYGIPAIVFFVVLLVVLFVPNNGDPEFGAIVAANSLLLLIVVFVLLYLVSGVVVWVVQRQGFIFLSAFYSALVIVAVTLSIIAADSFKRHSSAMQYKRKRQEMQRVEIFVMDSLTSVIRNNPNDYVTIQKRALFYFGRDILHRPASSEYQKYVQDLLSVIDNNKASFESYKEVSGFYVFMKEHDKAIKLWETLQMQLIHDNAGVSHIDSDLVTEHLNTVKASKKQYLARLKHKQEWLLQEKARKLKLIEDLTDTLNKAGYTSDVLAERGLAYRFIEKYTEALDDLNHAIRLDSGNRLAQVQRADVLCDLKKYDEAVAAYKKLIDKYPDAKEMFQERILAIDTTPNFR